MNTDDLLELLQERIDNPEVAGQDGKGGMCYVPRDLLVEAVRRLRVVTP